MTIEGIDEVSFGVEDLPRCHRFMHDWGLTLAAHDPQHQVWRSLNGSQLVLRPIDDPALPPAMEAGPTLREVVWGVSSAADLDRLDQQLQGLPGHHRDDQRLHVLDANGLGLAFQISAKHPVAERGADYNSWGDTRRIDAAAPVYEYARPIDIGHVVLFVRDLVAASAFYEAIGFQLSDEYPGRGRFLRCSSRGGHHDLFLLQTPEQRHGLNHLAFAVRDIHEVFGGGLHMARCGWQTQLGPGRHPISSAYFWYFRNPAGGLIEYYADEDWLTENWQPRSFAPDPTKFAEWAIQGGLDGHTRRQHDHAQLAHGFLTE